MQQTTTEWVHDQTKLGGQSDPLGIMQEIWIWPNKQIVYVQPSISPGKWNP